MTKQQFRALCDEMGAAVELPAGSILEGGRVLWAIAGVESSFGQNVLPRHEAAFHQGGPYFELNLDRKFGCWAHCSYGPLQVMFSNIIRLDDSARPEAIQADIVTGLLYGLRWLNAEILRRQGARTLEQIADAWNSGNFRDAIRPARYIERVQRYYEGNGI